MKTIILAGGLGTRLSEETDLKPKPMVLIDEYPILWHIMSIFSNQGFNDFILALGYKGELIKRWLLDLNELHGDLLFREGLKMSLSTNVGIHSNWQVNAIETGLDAQTGGRISQCMKFATGERVFATYGDGLGNVNLKKLLEFHKSHGKLATVTAVRPPARFGNLHLENNTVKSFGEKSHSNDAWINGGFFVLEPEVSDYILDDLEPFETYALPRLVQAEQLEAFKHEGFWHPMDTIRERNEIKHLVKSTPPPWLDL
jgi:glucose-1-phosphate cytidylyltransferase